MIRLLGPLLDLIKIKFKLVKSLEISHIFQGNDSRGRGSTNAESILVPTRTSYRALQSTFCFQFLHLGNKR